jgi:hypothetical protein
MRSLRSLACRERSSRHCSPVATARPAVTVARDQSEVDSNASPGRPIVQLTFATFGPPGQAHHRSRPRWLQALSLMPRSYRRCALRERTAQSADITDPATSVDHRGVNSPASRPPRSTADANATNTAMARNTRARVRQYSSPESALTPRNREGGSLGSLKVNVLMTWLGRSTPHPKAHWRGGRAPTCTRTQAPCR